MSVHDALPQDIYVDENGALWRCVMTCKEPTVSFEAVEGHTEAPSNMGSAISFNGIPPQPAPKIIKDRRMGGVSGLMWAGWKRIHRPGQ